MEETKIFLNQLGQFNKDKFQEIKNNIFFLEEIKIIQNMSKGIEYYKYIIQNLDINKDNTKNSYILWLFDKVNILDKNNPVLKTERHSSLPDIDIDFEPSYRDRIIHYLKEKYGENSVSQMATFGRLMGRGALKEVLRIHSACSFSEINKITENIPDEGKISDELQEMEEKSIILWSLQNEPEKFNQWCRYKDGKFEGEYAQYFKQAIRIEGTFKSQGKHAAGVIISSDNLNDVCPMVRDKDGEKIGGFEMNGLEKIGLVKFDLLGLQALTKLKIVNEL